MTEKELKFALKAVKAARKLGVVSMKLGSLEFELEPVNGSTRVGRSTSKVSAKKIAEIERTIKDAQDVSDIKDGLSTMHVEDPLSFERGIIENVIVDDDGGDQLEEKATAHVS